MFLEVNDMDLNQSIDYLLSLSEGRRAAALNSILGTMRHGLSAELAVTTTARIFNETFGKSVDITERS